MADSVRITDLPDKSKYSVAFDLLKLIRNYESDPTSENAREYFMELYRQCFQVVYNGESFEEVTKKRNQKSSGGFGY